MSSTIFYIKSIILNFLSDVLIGLTYAIEVLFLSSTIFDFYLSRYQLKRNTAKPTIRIFSLFSETKVVKELAGCTYLNIYIIEKFKYLFIKIHNSNLRIILEYLKNILYKLF
jgi:hypothetical protein